MISYLKGTVLHKTAGSVMVLCGAVGYEVQVPSGPSAAVYPAAAL